MANHPSAAKRYRQNTTRALRNSARRSRMRNELKAAREAIASGADDKAQRVQSAVRRIYKTASKTAINKKTASRLVSRLMKSLNAPAENA